MHEVGPAGDACALRDHVAPLRRDVVGLQLGSVRFKLGGEQGGTPSGATVMATSRAAARTSTGGGPWERRVRS